MTRVLLLVVLVALLAGPAGAQQTAPAAPRGCTLATLADPPRQVLRCADGLSLTAEAGAAYRPVDRNRDGRPEAVELTDRAFLIDLPPGRARGRFQILAPHAIASVRGTVWAVDVTPRRSSVFVERGVVAVRRPGVPEVVLRAGDGVDVEEGATRLEVKSWSPQRAAALLARLGR